MVFEYLLGQLLLHQINGKWEENIFKRLDNGPLKEK